MNKTKDTPIATEVIRIYKRSNKRLFILAMALLVIIAIETTYLIALSDSLNDSVKAITEKVNRCE